MVKKSKRYFGMTGSQIGILIGAGVLALLVACGAFVFILMSQSGAPASPIAKNNIPSPTPFPTTDFATASVDATPTDLADLPTSVPPPAGWVEFQTQGASLWLPANFVGGDMADDRAVTINKVSRLGLHFRTAREAMRAASSQVVMWMADKTVRSSPVITVVIVSHELKDPGTTIDQVVQDTVKGAVPAQSTTIFETNRTPLLGRETRRVVYQQQIKASYQVTGIIYYIKDGNDFWMIDFNMDPNEYVNMQPIVDQCAKTFSLIQ
jgi:hypothetical protein